MKGEKPITDGRPGPARHSRTLGFPPTGPAVGGAGPGPSQKAGRLSGPLHGWNGHGRSLVPSTGGAGTAVLWFPARAERGLEEERCAAAGERRGHDRVVKTRRQQQKKRAVSVYRGPETQVLRAKCSNTRGPETQVPRAKYRGPETQVLRAKCSNTRHGRIMSDRHGYPLVRYNHQRYQENNLSFDNSRSNTMIYIGLVHDKFCLMLYRR
jgi:hypothetical protein